MTIESPSQHPIDTLKRIASFFLKLIFAVGILWWLLHDKKAEEFRPLLTIGWAWLAAVFALQVFQHVAAAWRWKHLLDIQNVHISLWEAILLNWQSFFYSLVMPGGTFGGDVVKTAIICTRMEKGSRLEPASTILIDRIIGMIGLFTMILLLSPLLWFHYATLTPVAKLIAIILLPGCAAGILCGFGMFFHRTFERIPLVARLITWLDVRLHGKLARLLEAFDLYRVSLRRLILWGLGSALFIHLPVVMIVVIFGVGIGLEMHVPETVFSSAAGNSAGILPSFGGFGFREFTTARFLEDMAGMSKDTALLPVFGYAALLLVFNLLGGLTLLIPVKNSLKTK